MADVGTHTPRPVRNSEGLTVAESWRQDAERLEREAQRAERSAFFSRSAATRYRQLADKWEAENGV